MSLLVTGDSSPEETSPALDSAPLHTGSGALAAFTQTVVAYPYTGDYRIDVLLDGTDQHWGTQPQGPAALAYRWNPGAPLGSQGATVTYSFMSAIPVYGGTNDGTDTGFSPFTAQQRTAVREIMARVSAEIGINLVEVGDSAFNYGQIRFGNNSQQTSSGYSWLPYSTGDDLGGDVWIDDLTPGYQSPVAGNDAYDTLLHEIGHALGLKHPGNYNAGTSTSTDPGNYLGSTEDNENYTLMSYTMAEGHQPRDWYAMYDLLALKALYGSRGYNAGDTTYSFSDGSGRVLKIIDDAAGFDTIDISALSSASNRIVDMRPGAFSSVGLNYNTKAVKNLSIDLQTVVEKFIGSAYGDVVTGNEANNLFFLGAGTNYAVGAGGIDTAAYAGSRASYQASATNGEVHVAGANVSDSLAAVERLAFADGGLAFDLSGNAGTAAKIIGAVFGAPFVTTRPDFVGVGLASLDAGMAYGDLMNLALNYQLGPVHSSAQVVDLLYTNVVGVAPAADVRASYVAQLDGGATNQAALGVFAAESDPNLAHINLVGLAQTGVGYV